MNLSLLPAAATPSESEGVSSSSSIATLFSDAGMPTDFAKLLGDQLTQPGKELTAKEAAMLKSSLAAATTDADSGKLTSSSSKLNQLLAALGDITATLPAGLTHLGLVGDAAGVKKTTANDDAQPDNGDEKRDVNALQTLLTMLPHQVAATLGADKLASGSAEQANTLSKEKLLANNNELMGKNGLISHHELISHPGLISDKNSTAKRDATALTGTERLAGATNGKTTTAPDKLTHLAAQDGESGLNTKNLPLAAQSEVSLSSASSDKTQLNLTPVTAALSSPMNTAAASSLVSAPANGYLSAPLGSQEWQQSLGQQVLMFSRNGQQSAELRLHPQELGALQISLKMEDNQAQLHFASAHSQVRAALEAAMPSLRHALAESGVQLGQSSVGSEGQWQQAQQQSQQNQQDVIARGQPTYGDVVAGPLTETPLAAPTALQSLANGQGGVDVFA
ncbi:flagellar hook-length control protein [Yersinia pseudotuberculosis]|uniref:flagellar hook-length control protein FliK n=1 Tax=Yersinia pseudotuberculosis TaxID=633 RepID=UPI0004F62A6B|nr:flagellar hook-length control protein FliK [Yersinia pseudotuberculosis]AIN12548.1 flagellar hook-length control FliK family protein [Yersinia pseudotuberculosis]AJJ05179.1 flagellar hook-length control FliK family protein [Yersinia pseudotuberculosis]MBO1553700.1 flagellar hook-length control protein FliK [Yersinia pseudotuberculosis]MBO1559935.1 flagellar hook-length control protein FliK [Yersinia pseudotuberculosis]CNJ56744.1 flagellar hook-length control protein [Yersinia pseudotubercul